MNANKLADELEGFGYLNSDDGLHFCPFQAQVDMLRQQQSEIEELKPYKEKIEAMERAYDRHFEAALRADDVWKRATGVKNEQ